MEHSICIVEDDEGIQDVLKIILTRAGYQICVFSDGHDVMADKFIPPDLFLLDKQLPDFDGLDICRHLKASIATAAIPIVMMSAFPNARVLSLAAGADDFIEKPFQLDQLLAVVRKHVPSQAVA
jgi:DNA-binding response OmpR family regulator